MVKALREGVGLRGCGAQEPVGGMGPGQGPRHLFGGLVLHSLWVLPKLAQGVCVHLHTFACT